MRNKCVCLIFLFILSVCTAWAGPEDPEKIGYNSVPPPTDERSVFTKNTTEWQRTPPAQKYLSKEKEFDSNSPAIIAEVISDTKKTIGRSSSFSDHNGELIRQSMINELDAYQEELNGAMSTNDTAQVGQLLKTNRFHSQAVLLGPFRSEMFFFKGTTNQIVFRVFDGISLRYFATEDQAIEVRAAFERLRLLASKSRAESFEELNQTLKANNEAWKNYLENGYSQYPWESYLNSLVWSKTYSWLSAPRHQLVVIHPEAGLLFDLRSQREAAVDAALIINWLGYIHYQGAERNWFYGISGATSFSSSDNGLGVGATIHLGHSKIHSRVPHVSLSLLWHDYATGSDGLGLALNVDLYRLLNKDNGSATFLKGLTDQGE